MMKVIRRSYPLALVMAAGVMAFTAVLVFTSQPVRASETDNRIESAFKKTYVYKTYLKDEHIKISSKDGAVTLSGTVADETHKPMAQDTAEALPGSQERGQSHRSHRRSSCREFGYVGQYESEIRAVVPSQCQRHQDRGVP